MTIVEKIERLKEARTVLDRTYVKWYQDNGAGGHCAIGSVGYVAQKRLTTRNNTDPEIIAAREVVELLNVMARILYPQYSGRVEKRAIPTIEYGDDSFNIGPVVFLNNHVGKEAVLAVFDATILDLEIREEAKKEKDLLSGGGRHVEEERAEVLS